MAYGQILFGENRCFFGENRGAFGRKRRAVVCYARLVIHKYYKCYCPQRRCCPECCLPMLGRRSGSCHVRLGGWANKKPWTSCKRPPASISKTLMTPWTRFIKTDTKDSQDTLGGLKKMMADSLYTSASQALSQGSDALNQKIRNARGARVVL